MDLQNPIFQIKLSELLHEDWYKIGIFLKFEQHLLDSINNDNINFRKPEDKAFAMITKWLNIDKNPTFEKLKLAIVGIPKYELLRKVERLAREFSTMPPVIPNNAPNTEIDNQYSLTPKIVGIVGSSIGVDFESFGLHLGLSQQVINNITFDKPTAQAKAVAVISKWIEKNGISKWEQLKKELLEIEYKHTVEKIDKELRNNP
ncbi:uncharacterized protein LOC136075125 isoform X2 [Hydra vulgaris]|uniref:Uncharacterized protein LOC136075125 isoform X2 n=1 Tax=Hydra vulgaris TaxID=6087 RepID=A0ABM4B3W8_HYDVU